MKLGINKYKAWEWANTRKGYWHIANSYILARTITNERLYQAGFVSYSIRRIVIQPSDLFLPLNEGIFQVGVHRLNIPEP
jgi:hypothetical protein